MLPHVRRKEGSGDGIGRTRMHMGLCGRRREDETSSVVWLLLCKGAAGMAHPGKDGAVVADLTTKLKQIPFSPTN